MAIGIAIIKEIELDHVTIVAAEFEERVWVQLGVGCVSNLA